MGQKALALAKRRYSTVLVLGIFKASSEILGIDNGVKKCYCSGLLQSSFFAIFSRRVRYCTAIRESMASLVNFAIIYLLCWLECVTSNSRS